MKKSQEKTPAGEAPPYKTRTLLAEPSTSNQSGSSGASSKGHVSNYNSYNTPARNTSFQNPKINPMDNTTMDIVADSGKKKNRRKERKRNLNDPIDLRSTSGSSSSATSQQNHLKKPKSSIPLKDLTRFIPIRLMDDQQKVNKKAADNRSQHSIMTKFVFNIYCVEKPKHGKVFRRRSTKFKYINLRSFLGSAKTCVFETDQTNLVSLLKNLTIQSEDDESMANLDDSSMLNVSHSSSQRTPHKPPKKKKNERSQKRAYKQSLQENFSEKYTFEQATKGEEKGELIRGFIRVNAKNARDSYVSNSDSTLPDYFLTSIADRNGALDGDEVLIKIKPQAQWQDGKKTATVVYILNKVHPRTTVGHLKPCRDSDYAVFYPRDKRMPVMQIPEVCLPNGFKEKPKSFENILFVGKLLEWTNPATAWGVITDTLGLSNDLRVETLAILKEFCLDTTPFSPDMIQLLPKSKDIPAEEIKKREDIRKECVFTIDPLTARDLDDAVSVKELPNGNYEIGVHISDASYYLAEGTSLDEMVSEKATTIYLVDTVYHMLPVELCLHCSLLPGEDKLAFSVFWEMNLEGEIFNTRFVRTVLNSCAQLAYEHAQQMIEDPLKEFKKEQLPPIFNNFTAKDLSKTVNVLQKIAVKLREARVRNGSLRIDQVKLLFSLSPRNGEPTDFKVYENKEAHRLIEEFMLLANISVAKKISETYPDIAFLRCHEQPKYTMLLDAKTSLETCGIHVDISSSGGIHSSLRKYITNDYLGLCRGIVLNHIFAKPMTRARYFCAGTMGDEDSYVHYALSVPIYTHFTSPIRRYADIMVHRLLAASLGYTEKPKWDMDYVTTIAGNCNKQKYNAKRAGEASSDLYLAHYIEKHQPYIQDCVVVDVKDRSFDAIVLNTGSLVRIYQKRCEDDPNWILERIPPPTVDVNKSSSEHEKKVFRLILDYPQTQTQPQKYRMVVEMFSVVKVKLKRVPNSYKLEAYLLRPILSATFENTRNIETGPQSSRP